MNYPNTFAFESTPATDFPLDDAGAAAAEQLARHDLEVVLDVRPEDRADMGRIACQAPTIEYCVRDLTRLGVLDKRGDPLSDDEGVLAMEAWLADGRGVDLLRNRTTGDLHGYGWTRPEECVELPGAQETFAVRVDADLGVRGIGTLFSQMILSTNRAAFGAENVGFESWASNGQANGAYFKLGAKPMRVRDDHPTTQYQNEMERAAGKTRELHLPDGTVIELYGRRDVRLWQTFPSTFAA